MPKFKEFVCEDGHWQRRQIGAQKCWGSFCEKPLKAFRAPRSPKTGKK